MTSVLLVRAVGGVTGFSGSLRLGSRSVSTGPGRFLEKDRPEPHAAIGVMCERLTRADGRSRPGARKNVLSGRARKETGEARTWRELEQKVASDLGDRLLAFWRGRLLVMRERAVPRGRVQAVHASCGWRSRQSQEVATPCDDGMLPCERLEARLSAGFLPRPRPPKC